MAPFTLAHSSLLTLPYLPTYPPHPPLHPLNTSPPYTIHPHRIASYLLKFRHAKNLHEAENTRDVIRSVLLSLVCVSYCFILRTRYGCEWIFGMQFIQSIIKYVFTLPGPMEKKLRKRTAMGGFVFFDVEKGGTTAI